MRVVVDFDLCESNAVCMGIAPEVFEVRLREFNQLFNSMDPSPFHERDLDRDAEQFILSWAQEYPLHTPLKLVVHLGQPPETGDPVRLLDESLHNYFSYRYEMNQRILAALREDDDVREFYLGLREEGATSFRDVKHYKRRKRWLS